MGCNRGRPDKCAAWFLQAVCGASCDTAGCLRQDCTPATPSRCAAGSLLSELQRLADLLLVQFLEPLLNTGLAPVGCSAGELRGAAGTGVALQWWQAGERQDDASSVAEVVAVFLGIVAGAGGPPPSLVPIGMRLHCHGVWQACSAPFLLNL